MGKGHSERGQSKTCTLCTNNHNLSTKDKMLGLNCVHYLMVPLYWVISHWKCSLQAANYLDIKSLLDVVCRAVADMIKGRDPQDIRRVFHASDPSGDWVGLGNVHYPSSSTLSTEEDHPPPPPDTLLRPQNRGDNSREEMQQ